MGVMRAPKKRQKWGLLSKKLLTSNLARRSRSCLCPGLLCSPGNTVFTLSAKWTLEEALFNSTQVCLELALEKTVLVGEP